MPMAALSESMALARWSDGPTTLALLRSLRAATMADSSLRMSFSSASFSCSSWVTRATSLEGVLVALLGTFRGDASTVDSGAVAAKLGVMLM